MWYCQQQGAEPMGQWQMLGNGRPAPIPHQQAPVYSNAASYARPLESGLAQTGSCFFFPRSTSLVSSTFNGSVVICLLFLSFKSLLRIHESSDFSGISSLELLCHWIFKLVVNVPGLLSARRYLYTPPRRICFFPSLYHCLTIKCPCYILVKGTEWGDVPVSSPGVALCLWNSPGCLKFSCYFSRTVPIV